jgi:tRNA A37 threonylcarbamoyladenosine biosynthesis protein TsaE
MDGADLPIPTDASMVLILGETGAGKSFFVRKLTANPNVKIGHQLESCESVVGWPYRGPDAIFQFRHSDVPSL